MEAPDENWRDYAQYAASFIAFEGIGLGFTVGMIHGMGVLDGIPWKEAYVILVYVPIFLLLGTPALIVIQQHPTSTKKGAQVLRIVLAVLALVSWLIIDVPRDGWEVWLALAPSLVMSFLYKGILNRSKEAEEKRRREWP